MTNSADPCCPATCGCKMGGHDASLWEVGTVCYQSVEASFRSYLPANPLLCHHCAMSMGVMSSQDGPAAHPTH